MWNWVHLFSLNSFKNLNNCLFGFSYSGIRCEQRETLNLCNAQVRYDQLNKLDFKLT
jgi:hypothetical protein